MLQVPLLRSEVHFSATIVTIKQAIGDVFSRLFIYKMVSCCSIVLGISTSILDTGFMNTFGTAYFVSQRWEGIFDGYF